MTGSRSANPVVEAEIGSRVSRVGRPQLQFWDLGMSLPKGSRGFEGSHSGEKNRACLQRYFFVRGGWTGSSLNVRQRQYPL